MSGRPSSLAGLLALACAVLACRAEKTVYGCADPLQIVVAPARYTITLGDAAVFQVKVVGGFCYYPGRQQFIWSVSNSAVATITTRTDSSVALTATGLGTTMVTATAVADTFVRSAGLLTVVPVGGGGP